MMSPNKLNKGQIGALYDPSFVDSLDTVDKVNHLLNKVAVADVPVAVSEDDNYVITMEDYFQLLTQKLEQVKHHQLQGQLINKLKAIYAEETQLALNVLVIRGALGKKAGPYTDKLYGQGTYGHIVGKLKDNPLNL